MTDWVTRETRQTGATGQLSSHNKDQGMRLFCPARPSLQVPIRESETRLFACARVSLRVCVCVYICVCVYAQGTLLLLYLIQVYVVSTASIDYLTLT